jgi:hypothetical protein
MAIEGPDRRMVPALAEEHTSFDLVTDVGQSDRLNLELAIDHRTGGFTAPHSNWDRDNPNLVSRLKPNARCEGWRRNVEVRLDIDPHRRMLKVGVMPLGTGVAANSPPRPPSLCEGGDPSEDRTMRILSSTLSG